MLKQLTAIFVVDGGRHVLVFVFYNRLLAYTVQVGGFILKLFNSIQFNSIALSSWLMEEDTREIFVGENQDEDDDDERRISIGSVLVSDSVKRF
jgi:hypothetical protein